MHPRFRSIHDHHPSEVPQPSHPADHGYDEPYRDRHGGLPDRVTHLVLVDGQLVEVWHEPLEGSPWMERAAAYGLLHPPPRPRPPEPPRHEQVLAWLTSVCGGADALDALDDAPLAGVAAMPAVEDDAARAHLTQAAALVDRTAATFFDDEVGVALRRGLVAFWEASPRVRFSSPARVAGGVCWAIGRGNGLLGPRGVVTHSDLATSLDLTSSTMSGAGQSVRTTLVRASSWSGYARRPWDIDVDVELPGHPELLLGSVRARLVALRDQARAAASRGGPLP